MNELASKLFKTFFRSEKSFKTKKLWSLKICMDRFFSAKNIWKSDLWFCSQKALGKLFHTLVSTLCWYWPEFVGTDRSVIYFSRNQKVQTRDTTVGIVITLLKVHGFWEYIDNSVTWHRLNFRSFGLSIAVVSVFWFWVFLLYRWNISKYRWNKM